MPRRPDPTTVGAVAAFILCAAFLASFLFGLRGRRVESSPQPGTATYQEAPSGAVGRVEVLNASGRSGQARAAMDRLRAGGFDVVFFGNATGQTGDSSVVLVRGPTDVPARAVARHLGIATVRTQVDTALYLDATVVIGRDWPAAQQATEPADDGWRARISRWLRPGR
ncbi:hypothetical protein BH23GEM9_BH23GEM9_17930 [soil metagenome]